MQMHEEIQKGVMENTGKWVKARDGKSPSDQKPCHRITESQNSRGWKGPLWVI